MHKIQNTTDLYHMPSQPFFRTGNLKNSVFLAFEIESKIMMSSLKPLSVQQFVKNLHLGFSVKFNIMRSNAVSASVSCSNVKRAYKKKLKEVSLPLVTVPLKDYLLVPTN